MNKKKWDKFWNKFWFVVWKDNSLKGWIISLIFLFVLIKLIFFPLLNLVTGTSLPLVIVESCSMYHEDNLFSDFEEWWEDQDMKYFELKIGEQDFLEFPFKKGFNKGDILFVTGTKPEKIKLGDIIIFNANYNYPIIHRVIDIKKENNEYLFATIGDNNKGQLATEKRIKEDSIIGKAQANILPYVGWIKLILFEPFQPESKKGTCTQN